MAATAIAGLASSAQAQETRCNLEVVFYIDTSFSMCTPCNIGLAIQQIVENSNANPLASPWDLAQAKFTVYYQPTSYQKMQDMIDGLIAFSQTPEGDNLDVVNINTTLALLPAPSCLPSGAFLGSPEILDTTPPVYPVAGCSAGEDWGYAVAYIAEYHPWEVNGCGIPRLVFPITNEGPRCGGLDPTSFKQAGPDLLINPWCQSGANGSDRLASEVTIECAVSARTRVLPIFSNQCYFPGEPNVGPPPCPVTDADRPAPVPGTFPGTNFLLDERLQPINPTTSERDPCVWGLMQDIAAGTNVTAFNFPIDASQTVPFTQSWTQGTVVQYVEDAVLTYRCTLTCDSIDFNGDTLFPDDQDVIDFLSVLAGGPCSTNNCNDIDFNNDCLFPADEDFLAFLRVLAGGPCDPLP